MESADLNRDDGRRSDGVTIIPWHKAQLWDATCIETLALSYVHFTALIAQNKKPLIFSSFK